MRLPTSLRPSRYDVRLSSDFVKFAFDGVVSIDIQCDVNTDVVVLHCLELDVTDIAVSSPEASHPTWKSEPPLDGKHWFDEENQFLIFKLRQPLLRGSNYTIHVKFSGLLEQDYVGYYATPYQTSDGKTRYSFNNFYIVCVY